MEIRAEILLPTKELRDDIPFYTNTLKMKMDMIYPADNPTVAVFSGHGIRVRIDKEANVPPGKLRILCENPDIFSKGSPSNVKRANNHLIAHTRSSGGVVINIKFTL